MSTIHNKKSGATVVEIIVVIALITISFWAILQVAQYGIRVQERNKIRTGALNLAIEAIEATRNVRDQNWDNFASLELNKKYYPVILENKWTLSADNPGPINEIFSQWVILEKVYRDSNDNIGALGLEDPNTRKATAFVGWNENDNIRQIKLPTYLTNWIEKQ